jgi:pimeloyl-ACP methyl ester carboxylesterase
LQEGVCTTLDEHPDRLGPAFLRGVADGGVGCLGGASRWLRSHVRGSPRTGWDSIAHLRIRRGMYARARDIRLYFDVVGAGLVAEGPAMRERPRDEIHRFDLRSELAAIRSPTLVMGGRLDPITTAASLALRSTIFPQPWDRTCLSQPAGRLHELAASGADVQSAGPGRVAGLQTRSHRCRRVSSWRAYAFAASGSTVRT